MSTKTVPYNDSGINRLPDDRPVLYRILTANGTTNYVGVAQRGRVPERIAEHLGEIPGAKVQIEQFPSIGEARAKETNVISRAQPKYNEAGK